MASKKQLAWRKKFAKMSKAGKFKKKTSKSAKPKKSKKKKSKIEREIISERSRPDTGDW